MVRRFWVFAWLGLLPARALATPALGSPGAPASAQGDANGTGGAGAFAYLTRDGTTVKVPLFSEEASRVAAATVDEQPITVSELALALASAHGAMKPGATDAGKLDFKDILDRLIDVRLLVAEARDMGIADLPEVTQSMAEFRRTTGEQMLKERVTAGVKADPKEVELRYRTAVREWKVKSVLFGGELDAKQHGPKLRAPNAFDAVAKQLVAEKKARGGGEAAWISTRGMLPQVAAAIEKLKIGQVSAPVKVPEGFTVMKVLEIRYPEDPKARADAERAALRHRQEKALADYYAALVKRYAVVDQALLKSLDYHADKPGFEALKKDARVLAKIEGGAPITVGELTGELESGFFHGVERAKKEKKINPKKAEVFDGLLSRRIIPLQIAADKIEDTPELKRRVADNETSVLFSKFIEKAVVPTVKIGEDDARKYYDAHKKDYLYPTFYKVESVAFTSAKDAEAAVKKLRSGTDFKWMNANADGQVPPAKRKLGIEGTLAATALPKEIAAALAGTKPGDYRLHEGPESQYYVIRVIDVIGAKEQPFNDVRAGIVEKLQGDAITKGVRRWADITRKARQVQIYLTRIGA